MDEKQRSKRQHYTEMPLKNCTKKQSILFISIQEIQGLDNKIHETVETINTMKTHREFYLSFAKDPQLFINKWLISQSRGKNIFQITFLHWFPSQKYQATLPRPNLPTNLSQIWNGIPKLKNILILLNNPLKKLNFFIQFY